MLTHFQKNLTLLLIISYSYIAITNTINRVIVIAQDIKYLYIVNVSETVTRINIAEL
jgi:hypothetical protein